MPNSEITYAEVKVGFDEHRGLALQRAHEAGLVLVRAEIIRVSYKKALKFYSNLDGKPWQNEVAEYSASGEKLAMVFFGPEAVRVWREIIGPTKLDLVQPHQLRAFSRGIVHNVAHGSDALSSAIREIRIIFGDKFADRIIKRYSIAA